MMIDPLVAAARERPNGIALVHASRRWTWQDLLAATLSLAAQIPSAAGQRVAVLANDSDDAVIAVHAVRLAGATLVPLNRRLAAPELAALVARSRATSLLHDHRHAPVAVSLANGDPALRLFEIGAGEGGHEALVEVLDEGAVGALMYTSGTTGAPKGALLTHGSLLASASAWNAFLEAGADVHWLATLPLSHVAGLGIVLRVTCSVGRLTVQDKFEPDAVRRTLLDDAVTHMSLVPTQLIRLLDSGDVTAPRLRALLLGGAPIPADLVQRAMSAGLPVVPTYGLTEAASGVTALPAGEVANHPRTVGRPLPGTRIRITADDGSGRPPGAVGEVEVAGPTVFQGYDDDPEANSHAMRLGWLRTGDLGMIDDGGRLTIIDRRDDLIISGGENISATEVEAVLLEYPGVRDAAIVGRPDPVWGAVPTAALVTDAGTTADLLDLTAFARQRLAGFKVPASFHTLQEIPRTASGKVLRHKVRMLIDAAPMDAFVRRPDGARIHVRTRGGGPLVVLLHATLSNALELDALSAELARTHLVLAVDRRSAGSSRMPPNDTLVPIDAATHVDDVIAVLDALAPGNGALVFGHSYGGCIGLELIARYPARFDGLWSFEPPYLAVLPDEASDAALLGDRIASIARDRGLGAASLAFLGSVSGSGVVQRLPPEVRAGFEREGRSAVADAALVGLEPDRLGNIQTPVVVGLGGRSRGPYESIAVALAARIPGLRTERFPTLGHGGPISQSSIIAEAILAFDQRTNDPVLDARSPGDAP